MAQKMAQKSADKRAERRAKDERNMNRAVVLLTGGLIAEWYLLMADRFYAKGGVDQMLAWYDYLGVMRWIGLAVLAVGAALAYLKKDRPRLRNAGIAVAVVGGFLSFTSFAMRHVFPTSVTVLCVAVPVLLILGIICLFYQAEFAIQSAALAMALGALVLMNRSGSTRVKICAVLAIVGIAALCVLSLMAQRSGGVLGKGDKRVRLIAPGADYRPLFAVLALCLVLLALSLFIPQLPFFGTWILGIVSFALAVYYTVKLM